jgi:phenylalanyl-tRNA synthetase alpha chain
MSEDSIRELVAGSLERIPNGSISPFPLPASRPGSLHPITQIQWEIEDLFRSLGFTVLDGPEVETEYHNFDALNIPRTIRRATCRIRSGSTAGHLLRTHTSPVQVRGMEKLGPPLRMIAPGRVFRNEAWTPRTSTLSISSKA